ncbi:LysR family transcriptional regulator [Inquilinus limosus]|uniref:LysR family transcriptional regulator n=1 Tax=Inquilinus limosus TaxID=171674 RepID=UPI00041DB591|nr:LysR family transcriptional regulator [Inquilinus limosus]
MGRLRDLETFIAIVESGSLTAAARRLRRPLQSVSRSLSVLERSIGVELVRRTTRQLNPTEAGIEFYSRAKPAVAEINEATLQAGNRRIEPAGLLRIGAPVFFAPAYIVPAVADFIARHPHVELDLKLSDRFADLVEEQLDLAVRIGELQDADLKARRLGELRRVFFGAPSYFAKNGRPDHPTALLRHQCVVRSVGPNDSRWPYKDRDTVRTVQVTGRFRADHGASMYAAVTAGMGIGFTPLWQIRRLVDDGQVELILVDHEPPPVPIQVVWPGSKLMPAKTRLFIDLLADHLRNARL